MKYSWNKTSILWKRSNFSSLSLTEQLSLTSLPCCTTLAWHWSQFIRGATAYQIKFNNYVVMVFATVGSTALELSWTFDLESCYFHATGELKCNWKIKIRIEFVWEGMLVNAKLWLLFSVICCHDIWPPSARGLKQIVFKHLYPSRLVHGQVQKRHSLIFSSKIQLLAVSSRLHTNFAYINEQCCWDHSTSLLTILRNIIILRNIQTSWKQFSSGMVSWHLCVAASWKK